MRRSTLFATVFAVCIASPLVCSAQFGNSGGGGGGGGGGGNSGFGGGNSGSGFGGGSSSGFGGGGSGLGGGGGSGFGSSGSGLGGGMGTGLGGNTGMGGNTGFGQQNGMTGQNGQQQGFLGRNTNQQNTFLGRNTQGQGQGGQLGMQNNLGNRGRNTRGNNQNNINNQQQGGAMNGRNQTNQLPPIRPRQRIAFEHPKPQLTLVSSNLETRINKLATIPGSSMAGPSLKGITLSVDSGTVVLKGTAGSRHEAKLAENLARLEPGITSVRNEIEYPAPPEE